MLHFGLWTQFIVVCPSGQSLGGWRMTLLGELHSHNLQQGFSISHVSRAIRIENVCEHPLSTVSVICFCGICELRACEPSIAHTLVCCSDKKRKMINTVVCNRWLRKGAAGQRRRAARGSSVRRNLSVLGLWDRTHCRLYSAPHSCR